MVKWNKSEQQQGVTEITGSQSSGRDKRNKMNFKSGPSRQSNSRVLEENKTLKGIR